MDEKTVNIRESTYSMQEFKKTHEFQISQTSTELSDQTPAEILSINNSVDVLQESGNGKLNSNSSHKNTDLKPRIILTLRTSETDPDAYFSTSSFKLKADENKRDSYKFKSNILDNNIATVGCSNVESIPNKRILRRMSNSKESVLQNAIALKEKSFGIPETTSYKKNKSPKSYTDKLQRSQLKIKSPKTNLITSTQVTDRNLTNVNIDDVSEIPYIKTDNAEVNLRNDAHICYSEVEVNCNNSLDNYSVASNELSCNKNHKSAKRRKKYFKGLSYSFNNKKCSKKKKSLSDRRRVKYSDSSEQDTDSQNTVIISGEINEENDIQSNGLSTESSHSVSVLFRSATGIVQNFKHTSLDVINDKFNEKTPSPSTGDTPEKAARPESSTLISSVGVAASLCLCQVHEKVFMKADPVMKYHCQAVDSIEGKHIGCCNPIGIVDEEVKLQRPSVKVTYQMFCVVHMHRLLIHNCCPTCGLFCTQGNFVVCESQHMYHRKCELVMEEKRKCPHCGRPSPRNDVFICIGQNKNPVFVPFQRSLKEVPSAKMSFQGSLTTVKQRDRSPSPPVLSKRLVLPSGKQISSEELPSLSEKEKLEKFLFGLMPCISSSPAQRCTYRTMYQAAKTGDIEKLMACLIAGLNPNHVYRELVMGSALHAACSGGFITIVHILTQAGSQLNLLDKEQNTSLMLATLNGHNDVVKYLIKVGADVSFKGKDGMTALHLAAKSGNLEACYYLLSNPRSPHQYINIVDDGGWTALVWAAEHNHLDVVLFLLSKGADPLVRDSEQNIALHWSAFAGSVDISEALLHYNSDINCTNVHGDTPLHICARQNHYSCVIILLAQGARTDMKNTAGLLAVDCCINKPCDSYNAIKLNMQLKEISVNTRERTSIILTNDITRGHEVNPIQCVNAIDDEKEPTDFVYITENCFTSNIKIDSAITSLKSCKCNDSCSMISCTCGKLSLRCWYTEDGKLSSDFNYLEPPMIFECNPICTCNKITCKNRVVQHGITARFQLFRTKDKGWGVITLKLIPKGTYVCEYVGEIISDTEADTRQDDSYLFDLDNKDGETFCIDAFRYGNIARFINHSCIPNLLPVKMFINHQDLHFPRIAFFSNRDIQPYEELGFDYGEKFWIIKYKSFTCTCGAEACRYSETTIQKTLDAYNNKLQLEDSIS